jgi:intracellular septation protein A
MSLAFALQGLLPLIVFAIVDIFAGMRWGIIAAIVFSVIMAAWSWHEYGEVDQTTWISLGLILCMGLISIRMRDDRLFKFQPVVMAVVSASVLVWFQWQGSPLLLQMIPKIVALLPEEQRSLVTSPRALKSMARMDFIMIFVCIAHGVLVAWAALRKTTSYWLVARGLGLYVLMAVAMLFNAVLPIG